MGGRSKGSWRMQWSRVGVNAHSLNRQHKIVPLMTPVCVYTHVLGGGTCCSGAAEEEEEDGDEWGIDDGGGVLCVGGEDRDVDW